MHPVLTDVLVGQAVDIVRPAIEAFLTSDQTGGRPNLHAVVMTDEGEWFHFDFGQDRSTWKHDFEKFATDKGLLVLRTGMTGSTMLRDAPWLLRVGDIRYAGGVTENGLVVACSGQFQHYDEMIAWWILSAIQGLCRHDMTLVESTDDPYVQLNN